LLITTDARLEGEQLRLTAQSVQALDAAVAEVGQGVRLWLDGTAGLAPIRDLLARERGGRGRVTLVARTAPGQEVEMALPGGFNLSPRLAQAMKVLPGVAQVEAV